MKGKEEKLKVVLKERAQDNSYRLGMDSYQSQLELIRNLWELLLQKDEIDKILAASEDLREDLNIGPRVWELK